MTDGASSTTPADLALTQALFVEEVTIGDFRGIRDLTVRFEPELTVLVGANNSGKSRILRAVAVALGGEPAELDDLTIGAGRTATIDVIVAPWPRPADASQEDLFADDLQQRLGPSPIQDAPERQRFSWRTTIKMSAEGFGATAEATVRQFSPADGWYLPPAPMTLSRQQRTAIEAMLIGTRRDLAQELTTRGSGIRRVLSDLEIEDAVRVDLETKLQALGGEIVASSGSLDAITTSLDEAEREVGGLGRPVIHPLPPRLEDMGRSISIDLDHGAGPLPMRLHGSGPRSLASLQVQGVLYDRRLGRDGPDRRPHPISLVEEPEAHLHPQLQFELPVLLQALPGQVIVSSHSSHLVTAVPPECLRLLRLDDEAVAVQDLRPADDDDGPAPRALNPRLYRSEMEKIKRQIERPFGELLFASAVVIGDGATERAFLPPVLRRALGSKAHGVCVVDPGSMNQPLAGAVVKFADLIGMPWYLFADSDDEGKAAVDQILRPEDVEVERVAWQASPDGGQAIEAMMLDFDEAVCLAACEATRPGSVDERGLEGAMKSLKGSLGAALAHELLARHDDPATWPAPLRRLIALVESGL